MNAVTPSPGLGGAAAIPGPTARGRCALRFPAPSGWGGAAGWEQRLVPSHPDLRRSGRGVMTVGARLRGRRGQGRGRRAGDQEPILEQLELDDSAAESTARPGTQRSARRVHLAVLPERYEPLEEPVAPVAPVPGDKPKRRYRQKLKKYGKVGPPLPGIGVRGAGCARGFPWGMDSRPHRVPALSLLPPHSPPTATLSPGFTTYVPQTIPL